MAAEEGEFFKRSEGVWCGGVLLSTLSRFEKGGVLLKDRLSGSGVFEEIWLPRRGSSSNGVEGCVAGEFCCQLYRDLRSSQRLNCRLIL